MTNKVHKPDSDYKTNNTNGNHKANKVDIDNKVEQADSGKIDDLNLSTSLSLLGQKSEKPIISVKTSSGVSKRQIAIRWGV